MGYLGNFFVSIDQLGNAIAAGNADNTISSRVGFYSHHSNKTAWYWRTFEKIIDFTFYPIDGKEHCHEAYHNDAGERFDEHTRNWIVWVLAIFIIPSCAIISVLLYFLLLIGVVSPKKIDRNQKIKERLKSTEDKLKGIFNELGEHEFDPDDELKRKAQEVLAEAEKVIDRINE